MRLGGSLAGEKEPHTRARHLAFPARSVLPQGVGPIGCDPYFSGVIIYTHAPTGCSLLQSAYILWAWGYLFFSVCFRKVQGGIPMDGVLPKNIVPCGVLFKCQVTSKTFASFRHLRGRWLGTGHTEGW